MAKDAGGHGSEGHGSAQSEHTAARSAIKQSPNDRNDFAVRTLKDKFGYTDAAINTLRVNAGANMSQPATHQSGVEAVRDVPRSRLAGVTTEMLRQVGGLH